MVEIVFFNWKELGYHGDMFFIAYLTQTEKKGFLNSDFITA